MKSKKNQKLKKEQKGSKKGCIGSKISDGAKQSLLEKNLGEPPADFSTFLGCRSWNFVNKILELYER